MGKTAIIVMLIFMVGTLGIACIPTANSTLAPQLRNTPPPGPAEFEVSNMVFTLAAGELVKVEAHVENVGGVEGTYTATLKVNGKIMSTTDVTVAAGDTEAVSFACCSTVSDVYTVELDGFTVPLNHLITTPKVMNPYAIVVRSTTIVTESSQLPKTIHLLPLRLDGSYQPSAAINRNYTWAFAGIEWTWELQLPDSLYAYFKEIPRTPTKNLSVYINNPMDDTFIEHFVSEIERVAQEQGFDDLEKLEFVVAFVQSLPYTLDSVTTPYNDYPRYPIETLVDMGGDCEDTSILLASLLDRMGYKVVLIYFPSIVTNRPHYGVGILGKEDIFGTYWEHDGGKYFYLETTGTGWEIGEIPDDWVDIPAVIYDVN